MSALRFQIDPNVRVRGDQTYGDLADTHGVMPGVGERVVAYEPESDLSWPAEVTDVNLYEQLVYLRVEWKASR